MARITFQKLDDHSPLFWGLLAMHAIVIAVGLGAVWYMEHHGHIVTGMNNAVVWGTPHVFAVFLIVAASGAPVWPSGDCAVGRRPRRAGARSRTSRAADRRHDDL